MKYKKPGLRILKTGIAVFLCMMISSARSTESLPFYAAIAAVITMAQNVEGTLEIGINRIIGTILGGLMGLVYLLVVPELNIPKWLNFLMVSAIVTLIIRSMSMAGKPKAIQIMAIVFLSVTINHANDPEGLPVPFALNRIIDTLIGVITAMLINWSDFAFRKNYKRRKGGSENEED